MIRFRGYFADIWTPTSGRELHSLDPDTHGGLLRTGYCQAGAACASPSKWPKERGKRLMLHTPTVPHISQIMFKIVALLESTISLQPTYVSQLRTRTAGNMTGVLKHARKSATNSALPAKCGGWPITPQPRCDQCYNEHRPFCHTSLTYALLAADWALRTQQRLRHSALSLALDSQ